MSPVINLGKRREALPSTGSHYKSKVLQYLGARDFYVYQNSDVEGIFEDAILKRKDDDITYLLETKATKINLRSKAFVEEFLKYFIKIIEDKEEKKKFILVALDFNNRELLDLLFKDNNESVIKSYLDHVLTYADNIQTNVINNKEFKYILTFFKETEIIIGNERQFELAIEKIIKKPPVAPTISDAEYSIGIINRYNDNNPLNKSDVLYSNLLQLNVPRFIYKADTKYRNKGEVYYDNQSINFPVFQLINNVIYTFYKINNFSNLQYACELDTVKQIEIKKWDIDIDTRNIILYLLYRWVDIICSNKGLSRDDRTDAYFFRKKREDVYPIDRTWKPRTRTITRSVVTPMKYKNKINFWSHRAVNVYVIKLWSEYFLKISPRWLFSKNGIELFDGSTIDKYDRNYRKSNFNRNMNQFNDFLFWQKFLFSGGVRVIENYFKKQEYPMIFVKENVSVGIDIMPNVGEDRKESELTLLTLSAFVNEPADDVEDEDYEQI